MNKARVWKKITVSYKITPSVCHFAFGFDFNCEPSNNYLMKSPTLELYPTLCVQHCSRCYRGKTVICLDFGWKN